MDASRLAFRGKQGVTYLRAKGAGLERVKCRTPLADDYATKLLLGEMPAKRELEDIPLQGDTVVDAGVVDTGELPVIQPVQQQRKPTLYDATQVWNDAGGNIGRVKLREALQEQGFECSDDLARTLLANIKNRLEK